MRKSLSVGTNQSPRIAFVLPDAEDAFYRARAARDGKSLSAYLRELLTKGVIDAHVDELVERFDPLVARIEATVDGAAGAQGVPDMLVESIFLTEELLKELVAARSPQHLYDAQDRVKLRMQKYRENSHGKS